MAVPTYQSVGTGSRAAASPDITITKPASVAVGDILVALIGFSNSSARTISTLSGWTYLQGSSNTVGMYAFWKTADAGDVSASNYTFSASGNTSNMSGAIIRVSGQAVGNEVNSEYDADNVTSTTLTYTTALTPTSPESLLYMGFVGEGNSTPTLSGYTTTPSATWTERADLGIEAGSPDFFFGVATAPYSSSSQITSRGVTLSATSSATGQASVIVAINAPQNASADVGHLAVTPTIFGLTGSNTANATVGHVAITPAIFGLETESSSDSTRWENPDKSSSTWLNLDK